HKSELARAREAIDQLYRDLQEVTRELSAARAAVRESKSLSELSDDQRVQAKSIFDQRMEGIRQQLGDARLAGLISRSAPEFFDQDRYSHRGRSHSSSYAASDAAPPFGDHLIAKD